MELDNLLIGLANHAAIYANSDNPACQLRYKFLTLLRDDELYPFMESEFRLCQIRMIELTGQGLGEEGQWGSWGGYWPLYELHNTLARDTIQAYHSVMTYLERKWREAGGDGTPIPMGHFYGW